MALLLCKHLQSHPAAPPFPTHAQSFLAEAVAHGSPSHTRIRHLELMGAVSSWLLQCLYPEDQLVWQAARAGDAGAVRAALARLTPETQRWIEWQEPCSGRTALAAAAAAGHAECARLLLLAGADADARDAKGNSPLHLACKRGHPAVLAALLESPRARPFGTNLCLKTPLDVARHRFAKEEEDEGPTRGFQECIEMLEKRFCLYSGWMYQKTDNVLSYVSGISSLNSWTRRFCIVLERGAPEILELALFNMKSSGFSRPVCPSSVVLYHVPAGLRPTIDGKWFNRKEHTFTLFAALKDMKAHCESPTIMQPMEFAAVDREGYEAWKSFFDYHQENIPRSSQNRAPHHIHPQPTVQRFQPTTQPVHRPEPARRSVSEEEDEDLRRAIQLSLQTAPPSHLNTAAVSAPDWDGEDPYGYPVKPREHETNAALQEDAHADHTATTEAHSPPVVDFAQAPPYSSIGECVICFDGPQAAVCVPCGHNAVCMSCAEEILETSCECPVCRQPIRELIKLYRV